MTPISCGDMSSEMYLDIEVYLSESLQSGPVYHGVCLYGTTDEHGADADTNISICNSRGRNPGPDVTDQDERVTRRPNISICNIYSAKTAPDVTDQDERSACQPNISICNIHGSKTVPDVTDRDRRSTRQPIISICNI